MMTTETKTFAFKLLKSTARATATPWQARAGVATAGCTLEAGNTGDYRADIDIYGQPHGRDGGYYC